MTSFLFTYKTAMKTPSEMKHDACISVTQQAAKHREECGWERVDIKWLPMRIADDGDVLFDFLIENAA